MNIITRYKNIIIIAAVLVAAFIGYSYFFTGVSLPTLSGTPADSQSATTGEDIIGPLSQLHSITLDGSIFDNAAFKSLKDFSQALVPETPGRKNPFLPFNVSAVSSGGSAPRIR